jgi:protein TonB
MCTGAVGVFGTVYWINASEQAPSLDTEGAAVAFEVERKPPPKKQKQRHERPKPRKQVTAAPRAPMPNLAMRLSGASFDLPTYTSAGMGTVNAALLGDTTKKMVMTEGSMDTPPEPLRRIQPKFPDKARRDGVQGFVKMSVFVDERGAVDRVRILDAAPRGIFEEAAEQAIKGWEFQPGVYQGESVAGWVTQTFRFELSKTS